MRRRRAKNKRRKQEVRYNILLIAAALDLMARLLEVIGKLIK